MAARFLPWKGWVNLLDVTAFLNRLGFSFNLHFAGTDDIGYKEELRLLVKNKGLEEVVVFHDEFEDIYEFFDFKIEFNLSLKYFFFKKFNCPKLKIKLY